MTVVFLRGVNVGGQKVFRPSQLATALGRFDVVNVGAAGTFVVRGATSQRILRAEILRRLKFPADIMMCEGRDLLTLIAADPFNGEPGPPEATRFVTILAKRPRNIPALPVEAPAGDRWEVKLLEVRGRFVLSLWRRLTRNFIDPGKLIADTSFGVVGTTRNWNTILKVGHILGFPGSESSERSRASANRSIRTL